MPNLYSPNDFNMFQFTKEVKALRSNFTESQTELEIPFKKVNFYSFEQNEKLYIKLGTTENEIYGAMRLTNYYFLGIKYKMVERVCTIEKYRKNGIMKLLYSHCIELGYSLLSDKTQTTFGSKDFWIKCKVYFPNKSMYIINLSSKHKRLYTNQLECEIWGKEENEEFDLLEIEDKLAMLDSLKENRGLSELHIDFFKKNIKNLKDKSNVRLTLE